MVRWLMTWARGVCAVYGYFRQYRASHAETRQFQRRRQPRRPGADNKHVGRLAGGEFFVDDHRRPHLCTCRVDQLAAAAADGVGGGLNRWPHTLTES